MLKIERFTGLARSYGANIDLWPVEERCDARALLDSSKAARAVLLEERLLDDASPLVRGAAVWALAQLLPHDAFAVQAKRAATEADEVVRSEWRDCAADP